MASFFLFFFNKMSTFFCMRPNAYEVSLFLRYHLIIAILFSAATYCSPSTDFSSRVQVRVFLSLSGCELKYPKTSWRVRFFYSVS